jgi:hypothetical protein
MVILRQLASRSPVDPGAIAAGFGTRSKAIANRTPIIEA